MQSHIIAVMINLCTERNETLSEGVYKTSVAPSLGWKFSRWRKKGEDVCGRREQLVKILGIRAQLDKLRGLALEWLELRGTK